MTDINQAVRVPPRTEDHIYGEWRIHLEYVPSTRVWSWRATRKVEVSYTGTGKDASTALRDAKRYIDGRN